MRISRLVFGIAVLSMGLFSGCRCTVVTDTCGDGICDIGEDTTCNDCTFEAGESLATSIGANDFSTSELSGAFGLAAVDVMGAFDLAKPQNAPYTFDDWCGAGCSTTWIGAYMNVNGSMTVRGVGTPGAAYVDWVVLCEAPDGTLFANDDFDTAACVAAPASGSCDPGIILSGSGLWTCVFGASPFASTNPNGGFGDIDITTK
jgi:hypothetical protein